MNRAEHDRQSMHNELVNTRTACDLLSREKVNFVHEILPTNTRHKAKNHLPHKPRQTTTKGTTHINTYVQRACGCSLFPFSNPLCVHTKSIRVQSSAIASSRVTPIHDRAMGTNVQIELQNVSLTHICVLNVIHSELTLFQLQY